MHLPTVHSVSSSPYNGRQRLRPHRSIVTRCRYACASDILRFCSMVYARRTFITLVARSWFKGDASSIVPLLTRLQHDWDSSKFRACDFTDRVVMSSSSFCSDIVQDSIVHAGGPKFCEHGPIVPPTSSPERIACIHEESGRSRESLRWHHERWSCLPRFVLSHMSGEFSLLSRSGATLPHGMVKVGMDTDSPGNVRSCDPDGVHPCDNAFSSTQATMRIRRSTLPAFPSYMMMGQVE